MNRSEKQARKALAISCGVLSAFGLAAAVGLGFLLKGCMNEHSRMTGEWEVTFDISPDGRQVVYAGDGNGGHDLFLFDLKSRDVTRLTDTPDYELSPSFSPDGRSVAFTIGHPNVRADQLCVMEVKTRRVMQLTNGPENIVSPTFSPDGTRIFYTAEPESDYGWGGMRSNWLDTGPFFSMKLDGADKQPLFRSALSGAELKASKDGKWLAWSLNVAPSSDPIRSREVMKFAEDIAFSPDSRYIAFSAGEYAPKHKIYIEPVEGGDPKVIAEQPEGCFSPVFAPDGKSVYFLARTSTCQLWQVDTNGEHMHQVIALSPR